MVCKMVGEGQFSVDQVKNGGKPYLRYWIYIPTGIATDSGFPFKEGDRLKIRIEHNTLIIEPLPKLKE